MQIELSQSGCLLGYLAMHQRLENTTYARVPRYIQVSYITGQAFLTVNYNFIGRLLGQMISVVDPEVMTQSDRSLVNTSIELALSSTHVRQILTIASIESGRCDVEGYTPLTVTLNIIWCGAILGHSGISPYISISTPPKVCMSHLADIPSDFNCSGAWNPGVPAFIVVVPATSHSFITFESPKSARNTCTL